MEACLWFYLLPDACNYWWASFLLFFDRVINLVLGLHVLSCRGECRKFSLGTTLVLPSIDHHRRTWSRCGLVDPFSGMGQFLYCLAIFGRPVVSARICLYRDAVKALFASPWCTALWLRVTRRCTETATQKGFKDLWNEGYIMKLLMIEDNTSVAEMMAMFFQKRNGKSSTPMMVKKVLLSLRKHRTALILLRLTSICQNGRHAGRKRNS